MSSHSEFCEPDANVRIATAPVNWNNFDLPGWRPTVPFPEILDRMVESGYRATEYDQSFGREPTTLVEAIRTREMTFSGAYQWFDFLDQAALDAQLLTLPDHLELLVGIGCNHLIVSDRLRAHRVDLAGFAPDDRTASLSEEGYGTLATNVHRVADLAHGLDIDVHYHNHAGTYIEAPWEVDELVTRLDLSLVDLCFDSGHYAYGGGDSAAFLQEHLSHIGYVHLKDVDQHVLAEARHQRWSFHEALRHYVFPLLGHGAADIAGIAALLQTCSFMGYVVIEQDTCRNDPTETARLNREFLVSNFRPRDKESH